MKLRLLFILIAAALASVQTSCVQSTVTRTAKDGAVETVKSYGLSERAGSFADAYARHRLRMPQVQPTK